MEGKIYPAICAIMKEIGAISKSKKNVQQGFMYRGIDDVMNALQPLLVARNVFVVPTVLEQSRSDRETKSGGTSHLSILKIKFTFYADDGSFLEAVTVGESDDTGDKGSNKAMSIAFKYALFQVFCIPTEEMPDPDAETPEPTKPKTTVATPPITPATPATLSPAQRSQFGALCYTEDDRTRLKQSIADLGYSKLSDVLASDFNRLMDQFNNIGLPFDMQDKEDKDDE
jgi:hypothetical protein